MRRRVEISALTTGDPTAPRYAVQYAVQVPGRSEPLVYGDQEYVASREVLKDHPDGTVVSRDITITYGEWTKWRWADGVGQ